MVKDATNKQPYIIGHGQVRPPLQFAVAALRAVVVVVLIIIVAIADVIYLGVCISCKVLGSTRVLFSIVLQQVRPGGWGLETGTYAKMALDYVVYVGRTVLVELEVVARAFLWTIKIELGSAVEEES
jgi:hypothetical protein